MQCMSFYVLHPTQRVNKLFTEFWTDDDAELIFHANFSKCYFAFEQFPIVIAKINLIIFVKLTSLETSRIAFFTHFSYYFLTFLLFKNFHTWPNWSGKTGQDNKINSNMFYLILFIYIYIKKNIFFKAFFCYFKLSFKKNENDYSKSCWIFFASCSFYIENCPLRTHTKQHEKYSNKYTL